MEPTDAARGRALVERWCVLAEQRLDYLAELFESGRWRRFFSEPAFLANVQEAKAAVETWRGLARREASLDNLPVDLSWLGRRPAPLARASLPVGAGVAERLESPRSATAMDRAELPVADEPCKQLLKLIAEPEPAAESEPASPPEQPPVWQHALDPARLAERYPLLRQAS